MRDGQFGLYKNPETGISYFNVRQGDTGAPLEDILPETMRGENFDKAPIGGYTDMLYFWLTTDKALNAVMKGKPKNADGGITINPPTLSLEALRFLRSDSKVDYARITTLCRAISLHWEKTPQVGLIQSLIDQGENHHQVAEFLGKITPYIRDGEGTKKTLDRFMEAQAAAKGYDQEKIADVMAAMEHYHEAIRPAEYHGSLTEPLPDFPVSYTVIFNSWLRRMPSYHPAFHAKQASIDDAKYIGINPSPESASDPSQLAKASQYVWQHRHEAPQPEKLRAWLRDGIDLRGDPISTQTPDKTMVIAPAIFDSFHEWHRWQEYMVAQNKKGRDNFALVADLQAQHQSGQWKLPKTVIDNCHYFEAVTTSNPDLKDLYRVDYIDFAKPQIAEDTKPVINLKKTVKRKKISKRQLAELEDIVAYLLPAALRVGLSGKLAPTQLEYLAKAAKWLRAHEHAIWKKPWSDGLDLLAMMVMDKTDPLKLSEVKPLARSLESHIDEPPRPDVLEAAQQAVDLKPAIASTKTSSNQDYHLAMRRLIFDPSVKHFPGSDQPKDLILGQMGILRPDGIDEARLEKFEMVSGALEARRDDRDFWLMNHLAITTLLMNDAIDFDGHVLADEIEVAPLLRSELVKGPTRKLWNKIAGTWLYPHAKKPLPDILTKYEADTLQIVCHWLDKNPRRPRPFFWIIQDMVWDQFRGSPPLAGGRMRQLAVYIHEHRDDPPDYDVLKDV